MTTKLLLAAIALGLWANAAILMTRPAVAKADAFERIADDLHRLVQGGSTCLNRKLCE